MASILTCANQENDLCANVTKQDLQHKKQHAFFPLSPATLNLAFMCSILALVVACNFTINSARCEESKLSCTEDGKGNVAIVEHGVPLMWSKWVHRTWAHQVCTQGQGTRLADEPPHPPHGVPTHTAPTTKAKDPGILRGPLYREAGMEVPRTPTPGRRPGSTPGTNLHTRECQPRLEAPRRLGRQEDGGAKGGRRRKSYQPLPALPKKGGWTHLPPLRRILGREEATSPPKENPTKTPPSPRVHL